MILVARWLFPREKKIVIKKVTEREMLERLEAGSILLPPLIIRSRGVLKREDNREIGRSH